MTKGRGYIEGKGRALDFCLVKEFYSVRLCNEVKYNTILFFHGRISTDSEHISEYYILANYRRISTINSLLELISDEIYPKRNIKSGINKVMKYSNPIKINITFPHQVGK